MKHHNFVVETRDEYRMHRSQARCCIVIDNLDSAVSANNIPYPGQPDVTCT